MMPTPPCYRVYIAASAREPERVRRAQQMIADRGWILTRDWLTPLEERLALGKKDSDLTREEMESYATADADAIAEANVLWLLAPRELSKGAWWEHGYAIGRDRRTVVSGGCPSIFCALSDEIVATDEEAPDAIARVMVKR